MFFPVNRLRTDGQELYDVAVMPYVWESPMATISVVMGINLFLKPHESCAPVFGLILKPNILSSIVLGLR